MGNDIGTSRREFVAAMGASVAAASAIATSTESAAQNTTPLKIVDFHNHYIGPSLTLTNLASVPPAARPTWEKINSNLQSQSALLASIESAEITARVINTPTAFIEDADGKVPSGAEQRINDQMAELCAKHLGKLYGLATVNAFAGDHSARELTRAVKELGLRGVFVESARGDLLLGAKKSRPTLATAAATPDEADVIPQIDRSLPAVSRAGDCWQVGNHFLSCGDALEPTTYERLLNGKRAQLVFTDPPYNVRIAGNVSGLGKAKHREFAMASGEMSESPQVPNVGIKACGGRTVQHRQCYGRRGGRSRLRRGGLSHYGGHAHGGELGAAGCRQGGCAWEGHCTARLP